MNKIDGQRGLRLPSLGRPLNSSLLPNEVKREPDGTGSKWSGQKEEEKWIVLLAEWTRHPVVERIFRAINLRLRYRVDESGADCDWNGLGRGAQTPNSTCNVPSVKSGEYFISFRFELKASAVKKRRKNGVSDGSRQRWRHNLSFK